MPATCCKNRCHCCGRCLCGQVAVKLVTPCDAILVCPWHLPPAPLMRRFSQRMNDMATQIALTQSGIVRPESQRRPTVRTKLPAAAPAAAADGVFVLWLRTAWRRLVAKRAKLTRRAIAWFVEPAPEGLN